MAEAMLSLESLPLVQGSEAVALLRKFSDQDLTVTDAIGLHILANGKDSQQRSERRDGALIIGLA